MKRILLLLSATILAVANTSAQTGEAAGDPSEGYLTAETRQQIYKYLPDPPSTTEGDFANDFYYYEWGKEQRYSQEIRERCLLANASSLAEVFEEAMGISLSADKTPEILTLAETAADEGSTSSKVAKKVYKREKPFVKFNEKSLWNGTEDEYGDGLESWNGDKSQEDYSYPSTHSTKGWMFALALCNVAPERTAYLLDCANTFAINRVIMGRHWKSDIDAGMMLAAGLFSNVVATEAYQEQLAKAVKEYQDIKNGTDVVQAARAQADSAEGAVYDLSGRRYNKNTVPAGVHISNGNKVVSK